MLNNRLRKAGAVIPAAAILFTSMSFPAAAKTPVQVTEQQTISVINENFDSCAVKSVNLNNTQQELAPNIMVAKTGQWGGSAQIKAKDDADAGDNIFSANVANGLDLDLTAQSPTPVQLGDVITVQFDYWINHGTADKRYDLAVNLNGSRSRFVGKASNNGQYQLAPDSFSADEGQGRILNIRKNSDSVNLQEKNGDEWNPTSTSFETWNTVTVTIDTQNEDYEGAQTVKVQYGDSWFIGTYDADYTGDSDTTINPVTSLNYLQFDIYGSTWQDQNVELDNVSVAVTGMRDRTEYVSDLNRELVNENFSNLTGETTTGDWSKGEKALDGTEFLLKWAWGSAKIKAEADPTDASNMAYKYTPTGEYHQSALYTKFDPVAVDEGDVINISFDYYRVGSNSLGILLKDTASTSAVYKNIYQTVSWFGSSYGNTINTGGWNDGTAMGGDLPTDFPLARSGKSSVNAFTPITGHSGGCTDVDTFGTDKWYTVEITIDTANDNFDGKQTLAVKYKERSTGNYIQRFIGYFDADSSTIDSLNSIDRLTVFNGFGIAMQPQNSTSYAYLDNVKCSIQKPAFELWGDASNGHDGDKKFTAGETMSVRAGADTALLKNVVRNEEGAITAITDRSVNMMLVAALYDSNDRFIGAQLTEKVLSPSDTCIETDEFDTTGAATVKTFLWEKDSLTPNLMFGTFTAGTVTSSN